MSEPVDVVDGASELLGIERSGDLAHLAQRGVELRRGLVEALYERARVLERVADHLAALAERLGEAVDVLDDAGDPVTVDRPHHLVDVGGQRLELFGQRADPFRRLPDLLHELVDASRVVAERLREALDVLNGAVDGALVVGHDPRHLFEDVVGAPGDGARGLDEILEVGGRRRSSAGAARDRRPAAASRLRRR